MRNLPHNATNLSNPIRKLIAVTTTVAVIGLALMFSVVVIAVILVAGAAGWGYLWWKTCSLQNQIRNFSSRNVAAESDLGESGVTRGEVIEGEVIRVIDPGEEK